LNRSPFFVDMLDNRPNLHECVERMAGYVINSVQRRIGKEV